MSHRLLSIAVLTALALTGCGVNSIPTKDQAVKAALANVQAAYQRRADLIPNLVATVQGYAKQEKDVLTAVVEARAKATQITVDASQLTDPAKLKQFQDAQAQLTGALGRLLAVSENYPDLKSNQNFLALQSQLEGTENRIAVARRDYIEAVRAYNTELRTFPGVLWAAVFFRNAKPIVTVAPRRLDRGFDSFRARIHRQAGIEASEIREALAKQAEIVRMIGARGEIQPVKLALQGGDEARMKVAETCRRIGAHHVEIALALRVEEVNAMSMRQNKGQRRVIMRAEPCFAGY